MAYVLGHSAVTGFTLIILSAIGLIAYTFFTRRYSEHLESGIKKMFGERLAAESKKAEKAKKAQEHSP